MSDPKETALDIVFIALCDWNDYQRPDNRAHLLASMNEAREVGATADDLATAMNVSVRLVQAMLGGI